MYLIQNISWSWIDWKSRVDTHISCPCVHLPTWFLYLTTKLLIDFSCYLKRFSPWRRGWKTIYLTADNGPKVYTRLITLPLMIQLQSDPRSRIKLFKTFGVYIIVLCLENASNDTVTGLNWIPGTDEMDTYLTPARSPVFEWVLYQEHNFTDTRQNTWNRRQNRFLRGYLDSL